MLELWLSTLVILFILGGITFLVNYAEREARIRTVAALAMFIFNSTILLYKGLEVLSVSVMSDEEQIAAFDKTINSSQQIAGLVVTMIACGIATLLLTAQFRRTIAPLFPRPVMMPELPIQQPAFAGLPMMTLHDGDILMQGRPLLLPAPVPDSKPEITGFRPESLVHAWAAILIVQFAGLQFATFAEAGGLSGIAENIGVDYHTLLTNFLPTFIIPMLGVGIFVRRNFWDAMQRLGLGSLTISGIIAAGATVFLLLCSLIFVVGIWASSVSEETLEEQTEASSALGDSITTVWLALMVAGTAAVGEEIAFRGAMQPVFGLWATAIIFTVVHIQYTLTPAALFIFIVALSLGYIRRYFNTTTAIVVHFFYNLIPLLLALGAEEAAQSFIRHLL